MIALRRRAFLAAGAVAATAALSLLAQRRPLPTTPLPAAGLKGLFPSSLGAWRIDPSSTVLVRANDPQGKVASIYDELLERTFVDDAGYRVMLSVAYVAQGTGDGSTLQVHRPELCYRYAGYQLGDATEAVLRLPGRSVPVTHLETWLPGRYEPLTYWILVGGVVAKDHGQLRKRRILAALKGQVVDSMLVRVSSIDRDVGRAYRKQFDFISAISSAMQASDRGRVFGEVS